MSDPKIIVALDYATAEAALVFVDQVEPSQCALKVGKELFTAAGPDFIKELVRRGFKVFLDLKYHDIPNTVAKACIAAANLGVWMINVHTFGGIRMLQAAREAINSVPGPKPLLIGVTLLTSMTMDDLTQLGLTTLPEVNDNLVLKMAKLCQGAGLDGVVCSAQEARKLRQELGNNFCLVTPGIRLEDNPKDDQRRVMTPEAAMTAGASYIVIGRPITQSENPIATLKNINKLISL